MKKEKVDIVIDVKNLSPIAHPLAEHKLQKKVHKCIKKGTAFWVLLLNVFAEVLGLAFQPLNNGK